MNTSLEVCETKEFVVFTKVILFDEWIKKTIATEWKYIQIDCDDQNDGLVVE